MNVSFNSTEGAPVSARIKNVRFKARSLIFSRSTVFLLLILEAFVLVEFFVTIFLGLLPYPFRGGDAFWVYLLIIAVPLFLGLIIAIPRVRNYVFLRIGRTDTAAIRQLLASDLREVLTNRNLIADRIALLSNEIKGRSSLLRRRSTLILITIGTVLICAVLIVIFAGQLTSIDAAAIGPTDRLSSEISKLQSQIARLSEQKVIVKRAELIRQGLKPGDPDPPQLEKLLDGIRRSNFGETPAIVESQYIDDQYKDAVAHRNVLNQLLQEAWRKEVNSDRGYNDVKYIIATAITRVGVVVLLVFLVQILLGFYRYNTKLVAFYYSYSDALDLWNGDVEELEKLSKLFETPNIDFGKEPKSPMEDILRAISDLKSEIRNPAGVPTASSAVNPSSPTSPATAG